MMEQTDYFKGRKDLVGILKKIPFLKPYEEKYLIDILNLSKLRTYLPGELITTEGEYDCWLYVILSGEVRVTKHDKQIAMLDSAGGTFGELSVIDGQARSATVHAVQKTTCLAIDMSFMDRMDGEDRRDFDAIYYRAISEILAQRLRQTSNELTHVKDELEALKESCISKKQ